MGVEKKIKIKASGAELKITKEFKEALRLMEKTKDNLFITGKAGTGKSTLLKYFCDHTAKNVVVLAPTGVAAVNIGGMTIHSFFQFPFGVVEEKDVKYLFNKAEIFRSLETLIIDEISMVRADLMAAIDHSLRLNTGRKSPFGGVQIIVFGDLYQLPPVVKRGPEMDYLQDKYGGIYFFNAKACAQAKMKKLQLTHIFRQEEDNFKTLLNRVRDNQLTGEDLAALNNRHKEYRGSAPVITLASINAVADEINQTKLAQLSDRQYSYQARVLGDFEESSYPAESEIKLKQGAQIMMIKNDHKNPRRWVNGSLGIIEKLEPNSITVSIDDESHKLDMVEWEVFDYQYDSTKKKIERQVRGSFIQWPVKLAWAITIHKSQGKTFKRVIVDLGRGAFAHGQTYVALSRCTTLDELYLKNPLRFSDVILDKVVSEFHLK
jgi:ATP-dependent exoDNAse (exonuclease V) alpha subunit